MVSAVSAVSTAFAGNRGNRRKPPRTIQFFKSTTDMWKFILNDIMRNDYQYRLGKKVMTCPRCHRRTFKPYLDRDLEVLHPDCGRCNREINCGYHLPPRQFFELTGQTRPRQSRPSAAATARPEPLRPSLIDPVNIERFRNSDFVYCPIFTLLTRAFGADAALTAFALYDVGYDLRSNMTIWWIKDARGGIRSGKMMRYRLDGHRDKTTRYPFQWSHTYNGLTDFNYVGAHFGSHLLRGTPEETVVLVESEKTALVLTAWLLRHGMGHHYTVLATGGCSGLNVDPALMDDPHYRHHPLRGRRLLLIPDADATGRWREAARPLLRYTRSLRLWDISRYAPFPSADIADIILARR